MDGMLLHACMQIRAFRCKGRKYVIKITSSTPSM
jgi:hypothetical protein